MTSMICDHQVGEQGALSWDPETVGRHFKGSIKQADKALQGEAGKGDKDTQREDLRKALLLQSCMGRTKAAASRV